jgi:hypothetical protein
VVDGRSGIPVATGTVDVRQPVMAPGAYAYMPRSLVTVATRLMATM